VEGTASSRSSVLLPSFRASPMRKPRDDFHRTAHLAFVIVVNRLALGVPSNLGHGDAVLQMTRDRGTAKHLAAQLALALVHGCSFFLKYLVLSVHSAQPLGNPKGTTDY